MMYKRLQVSLPIWMSDFLDAVVEKYDVKNPDLVRLILCVGIIKAVEARYPEFKSIFFEKDGDYFMQNFERGSDEDRARYMDEHNYEAQRAIRFLSEKGVLPSGHDSAKKSKDAT